jgi:surface antigen
MFVQEEETSDFNKACNISSGQCEMKVLKQSAQGETQIKTTYDDTNL